MAGSVTLSQLAKMLPEQRRQRLHGIDEKNLARLVEECSVLQSQLLEQGLRSYLDSGKVLP